MSDETFISEQTQDLLLKHQQAVLQEQKREVATLRYRTIKAAEDRQIEEAKQKAIAALRRIEQSAPRVRRKYGVAVPILEQVSQGESVSARDLRRLEDLLS